MSLIIFLIEYSNMQKTREIIEIICLKLGVCLNVRNPVTQKSVFEKILNLELLRFLLLFWEECKHVTVVLH